MKIKTALVLIATMLMPSIAFASNHNYVEAYVLDTVAGNSTVLRSSQTYANTDLIFEFTKPDHKTFVVTAETNSNGVAITEIDDYYTKEAGIYKVSTKLKNDKSYLSVNTFEVFAGPVSNEKSSVSPADQVVSMGEDSVLTVNLKDEYGNPIGGHQIKLISSSKNDQVNYLSNSTNSNGEMTFDIRSTKSGLVTYTFYDITADTILDQKAKVVYFGSNDYIFANSFNYSYAAMGNSSGSVDKLEFEDVTEKIHPGDNINFTVTAYDTEDQVVVDYDGTVTFSVDEDGANSTNLANDYTFNLEDQGTHTFSLSMSFQQTGTYDVKVEDKDNESIIGEYTFEVVSKASEPGESSANIVITAPTAGNYSSNIQVITGTAKANSEIMISDNGIKLATVNTDSDGNFTYTTDILISGDHGISAAEINEVGTIIDSSDTIEITIDTVSPEINQILISPEGELDPGTMIEVKIYLDEDDLSIATLLIDKNIYKLDKGDGFYSTSFAAPIEFGEYPLEFILVDQLGNGSENKISVEETIAVGVLPDDPAVDTSPGSISNLVCTPDDSKVTLNLTAPSSSTYPIQHYRIYSGTSPTRLVDILDTLSDSPTWYISHLNNDTTYYFTVVAVDEKGVSKSVFDEIISCTPRKSIPILIDVPVVKPDVVAGVGGKEVIPEMKKDVSDSGPEMIWLVLFSGIAGIFYTNFRSKKTSI